MIVVVGRPALDASGALDGAAALVALAAVDTGARVELVGSVGDDPDGDAVALELGRAGIGHAALLRDPAGATPRTDLAGGPAPRLEAEDVDLGTRYHAECAVLVVADHLDAAAFAVARDAAGYHSAALIVLVAAGSTPPAGVPADATVLETPSEDGGAFAAFAALVGRYAALLGAGRPQADAWHEAIAGSGWEPAGG